MEKEDVQLLVRFLRAFRDLGQAEIAEEAGVSPSTVRRSEKGNVNSSEETLRRLAEASGFAWETIVGKVLPFLRSLRTLSSQGGASADQALEWAADDLAAQLHERMREEMAKLFPHEARRRRFQGPPSAADRQDAEFLWSCLASRTPDERDLLLRESPALRSWVLVEHLADSAVAAALSPGEATNPATARDLAELAVQVAECVPGEPAWRSRLAAYARASLACALDATGDREGAASAAEAARALWDAGTDEKALLDEGRFRGAMGGDPGRAISPEAPLEI